jgi:hypothetical protein
VWQTLFWLAIFLAADVYSVWAAQFGLRALREQWKSLYGWAALARVILGILFLYLAGACLIWRICQLAGLTSANPWWLVWPPR